MVKKKKPNMDDWDNPKVGMETELRGFCGRKPYTPETKCPYCLEGLMECDYIAHARKCVLRPKRYKP